MSISMRLMKKVTKENIPHNGVFYLTPRCTMNCKMCFVVLSASEQQRIAPELTGEQWLEIARGAVDNGMIFALLTGGEPLLHRDFFEILSGINAMGVAVRVNSNATLITPEVIEKLKKCRPTRFNISLYGASNETYERLCGLKDGYDRTVRGIDLLLDAGFDVKINFTSTVLNAHDAQAVRAFADERKLPMQTSAHIFDSNSGEKNLNRTPEETIATYFNTNSFEFNEKTCIIEGRKLKAKLDALDRGVFPYRDRTRVVCGAGRNSFELSWKGELMPCSFLARSMKELPKPLEIGFERAWKEISDYSASIRLPEKCGRCRYAYVCHVCAAQIYERSGDFSVLDENLCCLAQETEKVLLRYAEMDLE